MRNILRSFAVALAVSASAVPARAASAGQARMPNTPQIIGFSVVEALTAIGAQDLGGVFSFIPEDRTSMAMAAYLMQSRKALKLFIKKADKDRREVQGINGWDKEVLLYLVGLGAGPIPPGTKPMPASLMKRIEELSLETALPLEVIVQRRALRK